ncbi:putative membrane protein YdfJ with MMPL/SSD domain [Kitasatospora sp. GP30]|uniref:MMPL family transporter n=1 Tax=Kitasatospora sp. GP30 TaxID=3035084 RepID=UPI000C70D728|nr:MMPL family transporter [Kitasatospora sp. GP30]MDH6142843.1 putative membrane protein YdfJ with MMPL/SSD domain [Kitasatospora sp. GP30]
MAQTEPSRPSGALTRLGRFCYGRRRLVLVGWVIGLVVLLVVGFGFKARADNDFTGGRSESAHAQNLLKQHFPERKGSSLTLAIQAPAGLNDPAVRQRVDAMVATLEHSPHITAVGSPYDVPGQISHDGTAGFATTQSEQNPMDTSEVKHLISQAKAASGSGVTFALGGADVVTAETPYGGSSDAIGGLAAMLVILIAFGSLLAMGLTMLAALFGIGSGLALIFLLGHPIPAPSFSPLVATLLGLGVGIDYALFIVTRYREGLAEGDQPEQAVVFATARAGRSVLFAGATVVIAMLGLVVVQQRLLTATAVAASVTVLMTMITAVTLLPALLAFAGHGIDRFKLPYLGRTGSRSPMAERWARVIQRRPVTGLVTGASVMILLAVPALSMRLSFEDNSTEPHGTSGYTAHQILKQGFGPGFDAPFVVVAELPSPGAAAAIGPLVNAVASAPGVAQTVPPERSADGAAELFIAYPTTAHQDPATPNLLDRLRGQVIPPAIAGTGLVVYVGGPTAGDTDFASEVSARLPWLIATVIGLALILLLVLVRSVAIAIKAAVMTLLSVGAAFGVLVMIVQWGWLNSFLGFPTTAPVTAWVPLFIFPILFGLSTDYEVFLVSRIREEYDAGNDTREAVARGLSRTARVITAAAAIMVTVFLSVLATPDIAVKEFGLGLAVAVFLDATLVRMVLVPAIMELLGKVNWWLPRWLDRILPQV